MAPARRRAASSRSRRGRSRGPDRRHSPRVSIGATLCAGGAACLTTAAQSAFAPEKLQLLGPVLGLPGNEFSESSSVVRQDVHEEGLEVGLRSGQKGNHQCLSGLSFGIRLRRRGSPKIGIVASRDVADATRRRDTAVTRVIRISIRSTARRSLAGEGRLAAAGDRNREIVRSASRVRAVVLTPGRGRAIFAESPLCLPDTTAQGGGIADPVRPGSKVGFNYGLIISLRKIAIRRLPGGDLTRERTKAGNAGCSRYQCVTGGISSCDDDLVIDDAAIRPSNLTGLLGRVIREGNINRIRAAVRHGDVDICRRRVGAQVARPRSYRPFPGVEDRNVCSPLIPKLGLARDPLRAYEDPISRRRRHRTRGRQQIGDGENEKPQAMDQDCPPQPGRTERRPEPSPLAPSRSAFVELCTGAGKLPAVRWVRCVRFQWSAPF
jgi:hypothetical protein